ncbi:DUF3500 domain-containing protein [Mucilaginibacter robiniae]|uniref:DUF3500 domain-containing protein n=1 Tax=Mucilaginibacter robiniae TaxID=2728022 RepID=A0A7L5E1R9_9SPHI|nr:DUF3500 domain-containing protein [Mucilaginibacter robiniae]QJD97310.1 DUF3500 domain-containing protein [Mucilaginibacter robiniae]
MRKQIFTFLSVVLTCAVLIFQSCKKDKTTTSSSSSATITALTCSSTAFSGTAYASTAFTGTATVPYTGGNGATYSAGAAISSTGVTGLTATLQAGTLASGAGNLTYTIAGTPSGTGTATFAITFGGQTCSFAMTVSAATSTTGCSTSNTVAAKVLCAVQTFEATLTTTQLAGVQFSYTSANAIKWSNLPCGSQCREGLELSSLTSTQLAAAMAIVAAASGTDANQGYSEATQIIAADDVLKATAGGTTYSSGNYFIAFVGTPSATGTWQLQFGGHHLAINRTFSNGAETGPTPYFIGVEPKSWTSNGSTYAPLDDKHTAMQNMLGSLSSTQLASAKQSTTFSDVVLGPNTDGKFPSTKVGVAVSTLSSSQQAYVLAAIKEWTDDLDATTAASILATYQGELSSTYIAYGSNSSATAGSATTFLTTNTDYVRIDGPSVWIEFVCQSGVVYSSQIHYHTVWRDHTRDYGNNFTF